MFVDADGRARQLGENRWLARPAVAMFRIFIMLGDERDATDL